MLWKGSLIQLVSVCVWSPITYPLARPLSMLRACWHPTLAFPRRCFSSETKEPEKEWHFGSLLKEVSRQHYRAVKRLNTMGLKKVNDGEECQLAVKKEKLLLKVQDLLSLETQLKTIKTLNKTDEHYHDIIKQLTSLQIHNTSQPKSTNSPSRMQKQKQKQKPQPREIYYTYLSADNIPIHVGKQAADNDELSCNPKYRDDAEWWMHADGCPGSHVIIKSTDDDIFRKYPKTISDAAILASFRSKNKLKASCSVKLTRCKYVKKIPGSPAGQVLLLDIFGKKIQINMKKSLARFKTLESDRTNRQ